MPSQDDGPENPDVSEEPEVYALERRDGALRLTRRAFFGAGGLGAAALPLAEGTASAKGALERSQVCGGLAAHREAVTALAFSPDGKLLASGAPGSLALWTLEDRSLRTRFDTGRDECQALLFTPDQRALVSGGGDGKVRLRSSPAYAVSRTLDGHSGPVSALAIRGDGALLVSASKSGKVIHRWSLPLGKPEPPVAAADGAADLALSWDGKRLFAAVRKPGVARWALPEGQRLPDLDTTHSSRRLALSPDGRFLAVSGFEGDGVDLLALDGTSRGKVEGTVGATQVLFSPDGMMLVVSYGSRPAVTLYSVPEGQLLRTLDVAGTVGRMAISPDGKLLALARDRELTLLSFPEGQPAGCLFDPKATTKDVKGRTVEVSELGRTVTRTIPCGSPTPAGATCVCDCVQVGTWVPTGHGQRWSEGTCSCNLVCTCDAVCGCDSAGGQGYHYWHPN